MFSTSGFVRLYKSQVLSYIEYATPAVYHAPVFFLQRLDLIQQRFLDSIGISAVAALLEHNLCPLSTRRAISMLGLIHRTVLGKGPKQFKRFFRLGSATAFVRSLRCRELRHAFQLYDRIDGSESNAHKRSVLGLIYPYNLLPPCVVGLKTDSSFQKALQMAVKKACRRRLTDDWELVLSAGVRHMTIFQFHQLFT